MKRIILLTTGGTIASAPSAQGLKPQLSGEEMLRLLPELSEMCQLDCQEIMCLDSTNIQPEEWIQMAEVIGQAVKDYDGIVVSHGTDTMAYSAAALTFMLKNLAKPVILTGAQLPITAPDTDGKQNLVDAVCVAASGVAGVYVVFAGRIIQGMRAKKMYTRNKDAFRSINAPDIGSVVNRQVIFNRKVPVPVGPFSVDLKMNPNIALLKLFPGFSEKFIEAAVEAGYDAIILEGFGAGDIPHFRRNLLPVIEMATAKGVMVIVISQCTYDGTHLLVYDVGVQAAIAGAISAGDMTLEALCAKLMWVLGHTADQRERQRMMETFDNVGM